MKPLLPRTLVLLALPVFLLGCGGKQELPVYPVRGTVLDASGKPASGAMVVFHPLAASAPNPPKPSARVTADGSFRLGTYRGSDGAPAGEYAVTVVWPSPVPGEDPEDRRGPDRLRGRFHHADKPRWRVRVPEQPTELEPFFLK